MSDNQKTSESQRRAVKKYLSKFVDVKIRVEPAYRDHIQEHAETTGESMSTFIKRAIDETMARDKENLKD